MEINLIDECTRAELPLRDVGPFHHFRHYINDETNTPVSTFPAPQRLHAYRNVTVTNNGNIAIQGTFPPRGEANRGGGGGGTLYLVN